jgi:hypothetical protein
MEEVKEKLERYEKEYKGDNFIRDFLFPEGDVQEFITKCIVLFEKVNNNKDPEKSTQVLYLILKEISKKVEFLRLYPHFKEILIGRVLYLKKYSEDNDYDFDDLSCILYKLKKI